MCVVSEVDVGNLHVAFYLQHVNLIEGLLAVEEVEQVLPIHKHLKPLVPAANRHLRSKDRKVKAPLPHRDSKGCRNHVEIP